MRKGSSRLLVSTLVLLAVFNVPSPARALNVMPRVVLSRGAQVQRGARLRCCAATVRRVGTTAKLCSDWKGHRKSLMPAIAVASVMLPRIASAASPIAGTLINASDEWSLWLVLLTCATAGLMAEKTKIGAALSSPLVTMLLTLSLCNFGVIPFDAPLYTVVNRFLVPMAVPLLLFGADLKRVVADTGRLLIAFFVGAFASIASTIIAARLIPMRGLDGAWKFAAALCSRHIGGAINYVAVSEVLQTPPAMVTAGIAADNFVVAIYFISIFALANSCLPSAPPAAAAAAADAADPGPISEEGAKSFSLVELSQALSVAVSICWASLRLEALLGLDGWSIPIATAVVIVAATALPRRLSALQGAGEAAGVLFMQVLRGR